MDADRVIKTVYVEADVRSRDALLDFARYCEDHPQERFWQALRNWSGFSFIFGTSFVQGSELLNKPGIQDTFYKEGK
jgi:hypothetical protein